MKRLRKVSTSHGLVGQSFGPKLQGPQPSPLCKAVTRMGLLLRETCIKIDILSVSSVVESRAILCDPKDCSTTVFPVHC